MSVPSLPLRVLMTADTVGGVWSYALELARALAPHGVEISLATMGRPLSADQWAEARALPTLTVHESAFKLEWMEEPWDEVGKAGEWLLALERRERPDVVHLNGYAHGALPWSAPTLVVGHSCVLSWWEAVRGESVPDSWRRYRQRVGRGLRAAWQVVAPTRAMLDALRRHYGPLPRACVVPNARDPRPFSPAPKEPLVLAVGRLWDEAKNVAALAAVAPHLPWPVWVAGEAHHPDEGGAAALGGLGWLGRLPQPALAPWFRRAAIYALPARYEPFGLAALEAALAGCALVLGDIPSLREVWGDAALFVPPDDPAALHAALCRLIEDEALRAEKAARARARARRYRPARMAAAYLTLYRELREPGRPAFPATRVPAARFPQES